MKNTKQGTIGYDGRTNDWFIKFTDTSDLMAAARRERRTISIYGGFFSRESAEVYCEQNRITVKNPIITDAII